jgi:hypothetical protein
VGALELGEPGGDGAFTRRAGQDGGPCRQLLVRDHGVDGVAQVERGGALVLDGGDESHHPVGKGTERTLERAQDDGPGPLGPRHQAEPALDGLHELRVEQPLVRSDVGHDEQRDVLHAPFLHPRVEVGADGRQVLLRDAVEHHRDARPALLRAVQGLPGQGVAVPRRGGDEQPEVGGLEQLVGGRAVLRQERVEVGRVHQRRPARHALVLDQPGELGDGAGREGVDVARVDAHDGLASGGSQHPGLGHLLAQQAVEQGGLPGSRGAREHDDGGAGQLGEARQQVLVELRQESHPGGFGFFGTVDGKGERRGRDVAAQIPDDVVHREAELLRNVRVHTTPTAEHCGACSWSHGFILIGQDRSANPCRTVGMQEHRNCCTDRAGRKG